VSNHNLMLMGEFFDHVSVDYDEVHTSHIDRGEEYYVAVSGPVAATTRLVTALDIGCGSGLELEGFFRKVPNARVHCVDLSRKLLDQLLQRYANQCITPHLESYMTYRYPHREFDYVIASSTLHHLVDDEKRQLYLKLREALTKDGCLIVGDYFVSAEIAEQRLEQYNQLISRGVDLRNGKYHFDIPTTVENEKRLLVEAGFASVDTVWESSNFPIIAAR
jgi:tRNA (cmo5U34)-methyltransferase